MWKAGAKAIHLLLRTFFGGVGALWALGKDCVKELGSVPDDGAPV